MGRGVVSDCFLNLHGDGVTMPTWNELSNDRAAFHSYLDDLDQRLSKDGIDLTARGFHARLAIQRDFEMLLSLGSDLLAPVDAYFAAKYGRRALIDPAIGRMLVRIGHEAWAIKFPLRYGTVPLDFAKMIENGPPDIAGRLTKPERAFLDSLLPRAKAAFEALKYVPLELRVDWPTAVDQAVDPRGNLGLSKWASQQVVEKVLTAFVRAHGGLMPANGVQKHSHDLEPIVLAAEAVGLRDIDRTMLAAVKCTAAVRYPSNKVQLQEAVLANQASVLLGGEIAKQWQGLHPMPFRSPVRS